MEIRARGYPIQPLDCARQSLQEIMIRNMVVRQALVTEARLDLELSERGCRYGAITAKVKGTVAFVQNKDSCRTSKKPP